MDWLDNDIYDGFNTYNNLKKRSISVVLEQLRLRGEDAIPPPRSENYDVLIKDKDIKIKVKFSMPIERKNRRKCFWEFKKVTYGPRIWPRNNIDFYILAGFNNYGKVVRLWKISSDNKIIYRKNQLFIDVNKQSEFEQYEMEIIEEIELRIDENVKEKEFEWIIA